MPSHKDAKGNEFGSARVSNTAASLFDEVFSKKLEKRPEPPTDIIPRVIEEQEKETLPLLVHFPPASRTAEQSPPLSLPESDEHEMFSETPNTESLMDCVMESAHKRKNLAPDADENDDSASAQKRAKIEPELHHTFARKSGRPIYKHSWAAKTASGSSSDEEEELEAPGTSQKAIPKKSAFSQKERFALKTRSNEPGPSQESFACPPKQAPMRKRSPQCLQSYKVKDPMEAMEAGEIDDFRHEVDYLLGALNMQSDFNTKTLSALSLGKKCAKMDFRHFIRSVSLIPPVFHALSSAPSDVGFAISAAPILFMLIRDCVVLTPDVRMLKLICALFRMDIVSPNAAKDKYLPQAKEILNDFAEEASKNDPFFEHFMADESEYMPSNLMLRTLKLLLSRDQSPDLKVELLNTGALQFSVIRVEQCVTALAEYLESDLPQEEDIRARLLSNLGRYFFILEKSCFLHKKNQSFLISHYNSKLVLACGRFLQLECPYLMRKSEKDKSFMKHVDCLSSMLCMLINLSHENELCSTKLGQIPNFMINCLHLLLYVMPKFMPDDPDIGAMSCSLTVNLVERCNANRNLILKGTVRAYDVELQEEAEYDVVTAIVKAFVYREKTARISDEEMEKDIFCYDLEPGDVVDSDEEKTDTEQNNSDDERVKLNSKPVEDLTQPDITALLTRAHSKAHVHMVNSLLASYIGLLIGCLLQPEDVLTKVRDHMPDQTMKSIVEQLRRLYDFMTLTSKGSNLPRSIEKIIAKIEELDT